jgi:response regulator RpfG family c-di-GMP phosphodiesterase
MSSLPDPRSIEQALADLRAKYDQHRDPELARMIQQLETEIAIRERRPKRDN